MDDMKAGLVFLKQRDENQGEIFRIFKNVLFFKEYLGAVFNESF